MILEPWRITEAREVYVAEPWIKVIRQQVSLPNGKVVNDYHRIELPDYTIIYAENNEGKVIVERQYRHGLGEATLVFPAGSIEMDEPPLEAAKRELLEKTGYASDDWRALGDFVLHGNYGCGRAHIFRAARAQLIAEPNSDDLEDLEVILMTVPELIDAFRAGQVGVMGTMATLALATNPLMQQGQS
ncbi:MAG: NUDIX hydrolase [Opitutales bacterium]